MVEKYEGKGKKPGKIRNCRDAVIWVGQCYPHILCRKIPPFNPDYFFPPQGKMPRTCYVHEAELRGCCRRVGSIFGWLTPCESRIFLAHRGEHRQRSRGSLFGFYVFKRFEIITDSEVYETIMREGKIPWIGDLCDRIIQAAEKRIRLRLGELKGIHRSKMREAVSLEFEEKWANRFFRRLSKGQGVEYRSHTNCSWPNAEDRIDDPSPWLECLLEEYVEEWVHSLQRYDGNRKYALVPYAKEREQSEVINVEALRSCGHRRYLGAFYLVDALAADIIDEFLKRLAQLKPSFPDGVTLFQETVGDVKERHKVWECTRIPDCFQGNAEIRGELILLNRPYPIFEKDEKADFRGVLRIDGGKFIEEICQCYKEREKKCIPEIPYCAGKGT